MNIKKRSFLNFPLGKKRAQSGMNAAILVAVIAGLIVIYILFMPYEERKDILGINDSEEDGETANGVDVLLSENPGRLEFIDKGEIEKEMDPVNLYTKTESVTLTEVNSLYVKNGIFDKQGKSFTFFSRDLENTDEAILTFNAKIHKGTLMISVNGYDVFSGELDKINVDPIKIPKDILQEQNNVDVSVSSVGIAFWRTNEYTLERIKVTAEHTDKSARESKNTFVITESEKDNINTIRLRFVAECAPASVGVLEVLVNNDQIYSSVPDCGDLVSREFSPFNLITGENSLVFRAERGRYLIDQIKIVAKLKETPSYVYYFDMDGEQIKDIQNGNKDANITLEFVDDIEYKEAEIVVNSRRMYLPRTKEAVFTRNINSYVKEGTNSLKIVPKRTIDLREIRVELAEN